MNNILTREQWLQKSVTENKKIELSDQDSSLAYAVRTEIGDFLKMPIEDQPAFTQVLTEFTQFLHRLNPTNERLQKYALLLKEHDLVDSTFELTNNTKEEAIGHLNDLLQKLFEDIRDIDSKKVIELAAKKVESLRIWPEATFYKAIYDYYSSVFKNIIALDNKKYKISNETKKKWRNILETNEKNIRSAKIRWKEIQKIIYNIILGGDQLKVA